MTTDSTTAAPSNPLIPPELERVKVGVFMGYCKACKLMIADHDRLPRKKSFECKKCGTVQTQKQLKPELVR